MITEGIGPKAPQQVQVPMMLSEQITIYEEAKRREEHRAYRARRDQWGQGLKVATEIPGVGELSRELRPIYAGCLGEYAVQRYIDTRFPGKCSIDLKLTRFGDFGIDLSCFGLRVQVKTRQNSNQINLVRRTNRRGALLSIPSHAFCFCEWTGTSTVSILGWCWDAAVIAKPLVASIGDWKNAEVADTDLKPMCRMRDELETWKEARRCR